MILLLVMRFCPCKRSSLFFFFYLLWLEIKMSILDGSSTLVQFIDWVGSK